MAIDAVPTLCSGGGALAVTTTEATLDLTVLTGYTVAIWSDDQDVWFSGSVAATGTLVTGTTAASTTTLKADRVGKGTKAFRRIGREKYLIAKTVTGSGTLHVKIVERV